MKQSPIKKPSQDEFLKTSLRLPRELHARLMASAEYNGRTLNAEIISQLQAAPVYELLKEIAKDCSETKAIVKELRVHSEN